IKGNLLYVSQGGGISIYDVSDPAAPKLVGSAKGGSNQNQNIAVEDNLAVVARGRDSGILTFDVSKPEAPKLIGEFKGKGAWDVAIKDKVVYAASFTPKFGDWDVWDVADPANAKVIKSIKTEPGHNYLFGVTVVGDKLLVCSWDIPNTGVFV